MRCPAAKRGFTLIEVLTALLIMSLLALMSHKGLGAVLDAREHVSRETAKWQRVSAFSSRFDQDLRLAAPQAMRNASSPAPAWLGRPDSRSGPLLEFSRFAAVEGMDTLRRIAYGLNDRREIELWLWPEPDGKPAALPVRYVVLDGVTSLEFQYLNAELVWINAWPMASDDAAMPRAVRLRIVLASGEEIVRVFALYS